jgi:tetratricopeptide (TPR) repeat protein
VEEFKKVLDIQPNNAEAIFSIGITNDLLGKYDLKLPFVLKAFSLDPLNFRYSFWVAVYYQNLRDYENAEKYFKRTIELAPQFKGAYFGLAGNYIDWKGDTKLARQTIKNIKIDEKFFSLIHLDLLDRDFDGALTQLKYSKKDKDTYFEFIPHSQAIALVYKYLKNDNLSRIYFDSAKTELEKKFLADPEDIRLPVSLSITYAGLGEETKALGAFNKAVELAPKNAEILPINTQKSYLARIYTMLGDYDNAIKQIDYLLANYADFSVNILKLDPIYDPLRDQDAYKAIIDKYSNRME